MQALKSLFGVYVQVWVLCGGPEFLHLFCEATNAPLRTRPPSLGNMMPVMGVFLVCEVDLQM